MKIRSRINIGNALVDVHVVVAAQCDQMASLIFNIWPFTPMKIGPMAYKILSKLVQKNAKYSINSQNIG